MFNTKSAYCTVEPIQKARTAVIHPLSQKSHLNSSLHKLVSNNLGRRLRTFHVTIVSLTWKKCFLYLGLCRRVRIKSTKFLTAVFMVCAPTCENIAADVTTKSSSLNLILGKVVHNRGDFNCSYLFNGCTFHNPRDTFQVWLHYLESY